MAYSADEIKAFEAKERRIVKQSCLKAAVDWQKGNPKLTVEDIITITNAFVAWVYDEDKTEDVVSNISHPVPTVDQSEALTLVEKETGFNAAQVWAKFGRFPSMSNVDSCIKKLKG